MAKKKFIEDNVILSLELYRTDNGFGIWLSNNTGFSGIEVEGKTPEETAENIAEYVADYFYKS